MLLPAAKRWRALRPLQEKVYPRRGDRLVALALPGEGFDIGHPVAEPFDDRSSGEAPVYRHGAYHAMSFQRSGRRSREYPNSQMGAIALIRQTFIDADWQAQVRASHLLDQAGQGVAAARLALDARTALEDGRYDDALSLAAQARQAFAAIGSTARETELSAYESRARDVLALRAELATATALAEAGEGADAEAKLAGLLPRFQALGDMASSAATERLLHELQAQRATTSARRAVAARQGLFILAILAVLAGAHQVAYFVYRRRNPAREALL